jgi:small GTP-binding protein
MNIENIFKIIIIGDTGCGKTHLLLRKLFGEFKECSSTIGVEFYSYHVIFNDKKYVFQFWDTAGQERFRTITKSIIHGAKSVIYVYDITSKISFDNVIFWNKEISEILSTKQILSYLVGNKSDLEDMRQVSNNDALEFAIKNKFTFFETSAKKGSNIDCLFKDLTTNLINVFKDEPRQVKINAHLIKINKTIKLSKKEEKTEKQPDNVIFKKKAQCEC